MGIQNTEQSFGDFRKLIVDLEMDPRGQKREPLQQPLHVRIGALFIGFQHQPLRDLRIFPREFRA